MFSIELKAQANNFNQLVGRLKHFMKNAFKQIQYLRKASTYPIKRKIKSCVNHAPHHHHAIALCIVRMAGMGKKTFFKLKIDRIDL